MYVDPLLKTKREIFVQIRLPEFTINPAFKTVETTDGLSVSNVPPALIVSVPPIDAVAVEASLIFTFVANVSVEPLWISKSVPAPFPSVRVMALAASKVTIVLSDTKKRPTVCVGTEVIVMEEPELNCKISVGLGVVLVGVQLVDVVQGSPEVPLQV